MTSASSARPFALEMLGIVKVYGTTEVLHGVDLRVRSGSVHALVGANGAGKSTLLKIADGATSATAGRVLVNGTEHHFDGPVEARRSGIGMVFQERSVLPELSVSDNVFLNDEQKRLGLIRRRAQVDQTRRIFDELGVRIPPDLAVKQLGVGDQQMVEIAKALRLAKSVLILDEPTAALTEREVRRLFTVVRQIAASGTGIVYVSHRLQEVFDLCDTITVLRDGRVVMDTALVETDMGSVVEAIAGGALKDAPAHRAAEEVGVAQPAVLEVADLNIAGKLTEVSFVVRAGEILGVAGLAGSGRSTLLKSLFGIVPRQGGTIRVAGRIAAPTSPAEAIRAGLYLIPEDRKTEGLVLSHSVEDNLVLSILRRVRTGPLYDPRRSAELARRTIEQLDIKTPAPGEPVERLSGGNQQKVVLGKAFNAGGHVLMLDEPTFGVDVRAGGQILDRVRAFVGAGNGAVWVTSDLRELTRVADRILVLADGRVRDVVPNWPERRTEPEITHLIQPGSAVRATTRG
ncbi:sugar ABC transporter ATP-binding protein [Georgenia sp. AZ-5]|uniref:sugar ABC transporter ATP-binding protein n=1 Tax=Georgenia sp. AZ-5 TaxID=3367526 RepID=UPI003754F0D9